VDPTDPALPGRLRSAFGHIPVVCIGTPLTGFHSIIVEPNQALEKLLAHLTAEHGYRRFLYIGGPTTNPDNIVREKAVRDFLKSHGRTNGICSLESLNGTLFSGSEGSRLIKEYAARHPERNIDAVIAGSDEMAMGIGKYLRTCGRISWKECPITGFDDIPAAELKDARLTTVHQPLQRLGSAALDCLLRIIGGEKIPLTIKVAARFKRRNSCGCVPYPKEKTKPQNDASGRREQMLRDLGNLGNALMTVANTGKIAVPLGDFLLGVNAAFFSLVLFDPPNADIPETGTLLTEYSAYGAGNNQDTPRCIHLRGYLRKILSEKSADTDAPCMLHLRSGNEQLGLILYAVTDDAHPYMSGCASASTFTTISASGLPPSP
jgi:hypothetical protein